MGTERIRQKHASRLNRHPVSLDADRLARIRDHGAKGSGHRHLSEAASKRFQAKLERLRATGSVKGTLRVTRVTESPEGG